jgi:hypothetical protein
LILKKNKREEIMTEVKQENRRTELFEAITESIQDARLSAQKLAEAFNENMQSLRIEENEGVFENLTQCIEQLQHFMEFVNELIIGISYFDSFGLPADPISEGSAGIKLFQEMNSAIESKDWIMLSDLIEYELSPLLLKEDAWLANLDGKLVGYMP